MFKKLLFIALLVSVIFAVYNLHQPKKATPAPCSAGSAPCIAIMDEADKLVAKVNDFRFGTQGCIWYRKDVGDQWQQHCGGYHLNWIGPQPAPGVPGKI